MSRLRLMSQNQWNYTDNSPEWEERDMDCSAKLRMKGHVRVLGELLPDVVGGQEVNAEMQRYLKIYCMDAGVKTSDIPSGGPYGHRVVEMSENLLEPHVDQFLPELVALCLKLLVAEILI